MNQILVIRMNVIVLLCNRQVIVLMCTRQIIVILCNRQIFVLLCNRQIIVLLCNRQIIESCEETEVYGKVKSILFHQLLFIKAVLADVLTVQLN
jgi:hypothetical protein